jgi:hypothetical protein
MISWCPQCLHLLEKQSCVKWRMRIIALVKRELWRPVEDMFATCMKAIGVPHEEGKKSGTTAKLGK